MLRPDVTDGFVSVQKFAIIILSQREEERNPGYVHGTK